MSEVPVTVTVGKQKWIVSVAECMTFGELRRLIEEKENVIDGGLRLIYKGKSPADSGALSELNSKTGIKMMALRTKKQQEEDMREEKREKVARDRTAMSELRNRTSSDSTSVGASHSSRRTVIGDEKVDGTSNIVLILGKHRYRVNIDMGCSVQQMKEKADKIEGMNAQAKNMRILFKGKMLKDDMSLSECGAKDGCSMMILLSAAHHDAKEDFEEICSIERMLGDLEKKLAAMVGQVKHRFVDKVGVALRKSELNEILHRLKDNLQSVKSADERRAAMEARLTAIEDKISQL